MCECTDLKPPSSSLSSQQLTPNVSGSLKQQPAMSEHQALVQFIPGSKYTNITSIKSCAHKGRMGWLGGSWPFYIARSVNKPVPYVPWFIFCV